MNLGLGNRTGLRQVLLPAGLALSAGTVAPDSVIDALGLGVARLFERYCNRRFERQVGAQQLVSGDRLNVVLERYPVETVSSIQIRADASAPWESQVVNEFAVGQDLAAGLLEFAAVPGNWMSQIRITYTGGYWFDTTEDGSGVAPEGAQWLPPDLALAWHLCCQEFWNKRDKLGLSLAGPPDQHVAIARLELPPAIKEMLRTHRRMQLS